MMFQRYRGLCKKLCIAALLIYTLMLYFQIKQYTCPIMMNKSKTDFLAIIPDANPYWTQVKGDYEEAERFMKRVDLSTGNMSGLQCVNMSIQPSTPICLHDLAKDYPISYMLLKTKTWEKHIVVEVQSDLKNKPSFGFIDLGANLGVYTLVAANMGHKVVAVEPYHENILRLQHASKLSGTTHRIVLLQNGIAETRVDAELRLSSKNQGLTNVNMNSTPCTSDCSPRLKTILLSDLRYVVSFKQAIMKIDIQGFEQAAFTTFETLLQTVFIPSIYMEWDIMKKSKKNILKKKKVLHMIEMLRYHGYIPHKLRCKGGQALNNSMDYHLWEYDIVWRFKP